MTASWPAIPDLNFCPTLESQLRPAEHEATRIERSILRLSAPSCRLSSSLASLRHFLSRERKRQASFFSFSGVDFSSYTRNETRFIYRVCIFLEFVFFLLYLTDKNALICQGYKYKKVDRLRYNNFNYRCLKN